MIATISPNPDDYSTSMSTLRYADRAKSIRTHAVVNQTQQEKMVDGLKLEIDRLKMQLLQKEGREDELEDQIQNLNSMQDDYNGNEGMQRKRRQTVVASQMRQQRLVGMGIAISVDDVKRLQKDTPHLVNVSADPLLSEALLYPCREGTTRIGATTENSTSEEEKGGVLHQDILLAGLRIRDEHAVLINHDHDVELRALDGAQVMVSILSEGAAREWSTVVDIFIPPLSSKPVLLSLSRSHLSKTPKQVFFNPINIFDSFTHTLFTVL